ncbi:DUF2064 domain-containing protein [Polaribacter sp. BAL334]|uniref:TIGR04282 family arsenosugar biosynthesis glycosyltransferase n=1 Tax=Polaribacter sp. BAL334 TaxID=1708178 RepID=UPI0018D23641|nr:DUF2064 domain-containing protein [Polaribacter sp. BAL334]MBG7612585.1 DUF2064 domain-containing protein [Polaribacter sp. BAL334]
MKHKTAILIFANSAKIDAERKNFLSAEFFTELNKQTLNMVKKSGIEYFNFSEKNQIGNSFGERFTNAIEAVFLKGFETIITIGNDTPHLKTHHLINTVQQLEKNELVLGPSKDGGFYLMGIHKNQFQKEEFLKFPWQTNRLQSYVTQIGRNQKVHISFLEILNDLDTKDDIFKIIHSFRKLSYSIFKLLCLFIFIDKKTNNLYTLYTLEKSFSKHFNKGSPFIFD